MGLSAGTKLGPYEILGPLGAGGMGEVYRARDTRLDRIVAVKILPTHLSASPEAKQRFDREARAISSLNHPNICTLHDVGHQDGVDFLVMEYLEGETLADRLKKGPLLLDAVLRHGGEIAAGLEKAHRSGVVHRDLKPGNIMLTKTGAKLMDFGLAKSSAGVNPALSAMTASIQSPGSGQPLTAEGTVVGTFQYMSPEQIEGKDADARSDIFALGAVLYEMATGRRAFDGKTAASVFAEVLSRDPPSLSSLQPMWPAALDRVVRTCLAKDPNDRFQAVRDVGLQLQWITEERATPSGVSASGLRPGPQGGIAPPRTSLAFNVAAVVVIAALAGVAAWFLKPAPAPAPRRVTQFSIELPAGDALGGSWWEYSSVALSPDGSHLAYVATRNGVTQLYLRAMNELEGRALAGTENATNPFFSPDGQWVGFLANFNLQKIPVAGGPPVIISALNAYDLLGACWAPDDMIYVGARAPFGILKVRAGGGKPEPATKLDAKKQETDHAYPQVLPGGKAMLVVVRHGDQPSFDEADVEAVTLATGERRSVVKSATDPRYLPTGHLVFIRAGVLMAVPFDPVRLETKGEAVPILEHVAENPRVGAGQYSVSANGSLVYFPGGLSFGDHELVIVDHSGAARLLTTRRRAYEDFSISPDGRFIATTIEGPVTDTWLLDIARDTESRFTLGVEHRDPAWSADGKHIIYNGYKDGQWGLFWKRSDGSGGEERLLPTDVPCTPWFCAPDGSVLVYDISPASGEEMWALPLEGERKPRPLIQNGFVGEWVTISPDGKWMAYGSHESGQTEVYVTPYPGLGSKERISTEGGTHPLWAPNGRELYYRTGVSMSAQEQGAFGQLTQIMAVPIELKPTFKAGKPHALFQGPYFASGHDYALTPDGRNFIFMRETKPQSASSEMRMILNWFEELQHRVPAS